MASFLSPLLGAGAIRYALANTRSGGVLANRLLTAFDSKQRKRGLLGRDSLEKGSAMIIAPCSSVHTFFMRFAIDVAFVAKDGRVIKVCAAVRPWRIAAALRAFAVIELPAGALERSDTVSGDIVALRPVSDLASHS
jgi:uncharacterized membrane protein (UPF0127 family)